MSESVRSPRRVLIVVSAWEPAMVADMHRARMLAWELPRCGWQVEILTPLASEVRPDVLESGAARFFPPRTPAHAVSSFARPIWRALGSRTHAWRTLLPMARELRRLLRSGRFDLVYFSTTTFVYFALGPRVCRRFGVPYVLDFHDPWVRKRSSSISPQSFRARIAMSIGSGLERSAVTDAAAIVSVSPTYIGELRDRHASPPPAWAASGRSATIPFGARPGDLEEAARTLAPSPAGSGIVVTYVGAGGAIMRRGWELVCAALAELRRRGDLRLDRFRIRLLGTTYGWKSGDPCILQSVADEAGVGDLVEERPERVSYRDSLQALLAGDGALVLGVDDAGYMPSKLFTYALSGKALLAVFRHDGPAYRRMVESPQLGSVLWFDAAGTMPLAEAVRELDRFLELAASRKPTDRAQELGPFLADEMARRHANLFEDCLEAAPS